MGDNKWDIVLVDSPNTAKEPLAGRACLTLCYIYLGSQHLNDSIFPHKHVRCRHAWVSLLSFMSQ